MTQKARDSAPVGEANSSSDLVEGIADACEAYVNEVDRDAAVRAALAAFAARGMVVVPSGALTPRDETPVVPVCDHDWTKWRYSYGYRAGDRSSVHDMTRACSKCHVSQLVRAGT